MKGCVFCERENPCCWWREKYSWHSQIYLAKEVFPRLKQWRRTSYWTCAKWKAGFDTAGHNASQIGRLYRLPQIEGKYIHSHYNDYCKGRGSWQGIGIGAWSGWLYNKAFQHEELMARVKANLRRLLPLRRLKEAKQLFEIRRLGDRYRTLWSKKKQWGNWADIKGIWTCKIPGIAAGQIFSRETLLEKVWVMNITATSVRWMWL